MIPNAPSNRPRIIIVYNPRWYSFLRGWPSLTYHQVRPITFPIDWIWSRSSPPNLTIYCTWFPRELVWSLTLHNISRNYSCYPSWSIELERVYTESWIFNRRDMNHHQWCSCSQSVSDDEYWYPSGCRCYTVTNIYGLDVHFMYWIDTLTSLSG